MDMKNKILFITGKLAEKNLKKILDSIKDKNFIYETRDLKVNVAALLTTEMIYRRIGDIDGFNKIILPGKVRGDIDELAKKLNIAIERGPEELKDLPVMFGGIPLIYVPHTWRDHTLEEYHQT